ncbi:hypothetical protein SNOUR_42130 [Streptomyces noursei ATCC 11455]|nr:hypothetical protein SNOUR_42130 [Streptomyces noursei ATCC 11455]
MGDAGVATLDSAVGSFGMAGRPAPTLHPVRKKRSTASNGVLSMSPRSRTRLVSIAVRWPSLTWA